MKITEQKISFKETVRGKQTEPREQKISISSTSTPSRTPSPFLKPHERKDYVPPPKSEVQLKKAVINSSDENAKAAKSKRKRSTSASSVEIEVRTTKKIEVLRKDSRKAEKVELKKNDESRKRPAALEGSDVESVASEKSKKRKKKKSRDGSLSEESEKKKKHKLKKHKKSSKKSKKKDRSVSREKSSGTEEGSTVNEYLEKKLREKALVSLMRKNKKAQ